MEKASCTIIIVEDDPGHATLIKKNLMRTGIRNSMVHLTNGQELLDYLFCRGEFEGHTLPKNLLVLLDINMPVMDGIQVLKVLKENEETHKVPVIILTTSGNHEEINACYDLGCNVYIKKPVEYEEFCTAIQKLGFFLHIVAVPED